MWNQCYISLLAWFSEKAAKTDAQNYAPAVYNWPLNLHDNARQCCKGKAARI